MAHKQKPALEEELSVYEAKKAEWLKSHKGQFVLIGKKNTAGFFSTYEAAFEAGVRNFGLDDFLIKQVVEHEPVFVIY